MWKDLRFALRTYRRSPVFFAVAVLSLALGIGANTAIFSLLYQVVLRSIPIRNPETLVSLESDDYSFGTTRRDNNKTVFSYPMYRALRDHAEAFSGLIARSSFPATLAWRGAAARTAAEVVTGNFFQVLGVRPALGRLLTPADDSVPEQDPVIVLSYSYWADRLGRDPGVLNSQVLMNGHPVLVVGVAAEGFRGLLAGQTPGFFVPVSMIKMVSPDWAKNDQVDAYWLNIFGRLKPGVSSQRADAMLLPLFRAALQDELPKMEGVTAEARKKILAKTLHVYPAAQGLNEFGEQWRRPVLVLMAMVALVLLIACANVASLFIARATARQQEIAVRLAIGASAWQLARQLIVESLVLTVTGGLLGLSVSGSLIQGLLHLLPADEGGGWLTAQLDFRLFSFSLALALLTGLFFGLLPALQQARPDLAPALSEQSRGLSAGISRSRIRRLSVVAQICTSLLLLIAAGLFTRSLFNLMHTNVGFQADHLVTFSIDPSLSGYSGERSRALVRELEARLNSPPGARSVATAAFSPFGGWGWGNGVKVPGSRNASDHYADCSEDAVGPGFFRTLGIPLIAGREFDARDAETSPKVAIINATFARFLFENGSPIGRRMISGADDAEVEIVGIVKDSKYDDVREKPARFMYVPYDQAQGQFTRQAAFFVRTLGDQHAIMSAIRVTMSQLDRNVPIEGLTSMQLLVDNSFYRDRLIATLAIAFGALATLITAVGLYGTISYSVARRTREFGIRLALGAIPKDLLLSVMREVGSLVAAGVALGLPFAYILGRFVETQFYGLNAHDPLVLIAASLLIGAVAFLAGLLPARRAAQVEPVRALRHE